MVKVVWENNCVGCPQGCVHCGQDKQLAIDRLICDSCDDSVDELYEDAWGNFVCFECLMKQTKKIDFDSDPREFI